MDKEMLDKLRKLFGFGEDVTEETIFTKMEEHHSKQASSLKEVQDEILKLKAKKPDDKKASAIDPNTLELVGSTVDDKITLLVEGGHILPAVGEKLSSILAGKTGTRNVIALSLGENQEPGIAVQVIDALKENDPVELGEHTKSQAVALNRETPGGDEEADKESKKAGGEGMMAGAGVEEEKKKD